MKKKADAEKETQKPPPPKKWMDDSPLPKSPTAR